MLPSISEKLYVTTLKACFRANITTTKITGKNISKRVDIRFLFINIIFFFIRARSFQQYEEDDGIYNLFIYITFIFR